MADPLEGFRDLTPEETEARLRDRLGQHDFLVDLWQMGEHMAAYVETPVGAYVVKTIGDGLNSNLLSLLSQSDPETELARKHFYEARRYWTVLLLMEETIATGKHSELLIIADDQQVTP